MPIINVLPRNSDSSTDSDKKLAAVLGDKSVCIIFYTRGDFFERAPQKH